MKNGIKIFLSLALAGTLAGFCNGLLGAGGGLVLVIFLSKLAKNDAESSRSVFANALCVMLPLSLLTLLSYGGPDRFSEMTLSPDFVLGAALGGILGGFVLGKIGGKSMSRIFAILTVISGILMVTR